MSRPRLLNCCCSGCSIVYAIFSTAVRGVDGILVFELCDVVVVFNALLPTAVCGVDGIVVLELCDVVVVFDAVSPTAGCGVDGILVLGLCDVVVVFDAIFSTAACGVDGVLVREFCDVAVVFDLAVAINIGFTDHLITAYWPSPSQLTAQSQAHAGGAHPPGLQVWAVDVVTSKIKFCYGSRSHQL